MAIIYKIPGYKIAGYKIGHAPSPHAIVEDYIKTMTKPTVTVSNDQVTVSFTPFPDEIADLIVSTKCVQFGVVRHHGDGKVHRGTGSVQSEGYAYKKLYAKHNRGDYGFNYQNGNQKFLDEVQTPTQAEAVAIGEPQLSAWWPAGIDGPVPDYTCYYPNEVGHIILTIPSVFTKNEMNPTKAELTSGQFTRNISMLKYMKPNSSQKYAKSGIVRRKCHYAVGFIYKNSNFWPIHFKMAGIAISYAN